MCCAGVGSQNELKAVVLAKLEGSEIKYSFPDISRQCPSKHFHVRELLHAAHRTGGTPTPNLRPHNVYDSTILGIHTSFDHCATSLSNLKNRNARSRIIGDAPLVNQLGAKAKQVSHGRL